MSEKKEEKLNIFQKIAKIRGIADVVKKSKIGYNYTYADIIEILAKVTAGMNKYGLLLIPSIVPGTSEIEPVTVVNTKFDKQGKPYDQTSTEMRYKGDMLFTWIDTENNDKIEVPWTITGAQADPSQAFGSGLTYCTRYFLTGFFQIAQSDIDPDAYRAKQKEAAEEEEKKILDEIIKEIDSAVNKYVSENPDQREEVTKLISKYEKSANYLKIKHPEIAGKLLEDFTKTFIDLKEKKDE